MAEPVSIGLPKTLRSIEAALQSARACNPLNIVIVCETEEGAVMFSCKEGDPLTRAETNYLLDRGKWMLLGGGCDV